MSVYTVAIEELSLSGQISLPVNMKSSSYYRYAREINKILEHENASWRCKASLKDMTLSVISLEDKI